MTQSKNETLGPHSHPQRRSFRKRLISRFVWNIMDWLPTKVRQYWIRQMFTLDYSFPPEMTFKRAETFHEFEQAFKLIYESYRELGLTKENFNKIRVTKFNALPSTALLIAKWKDEVIATMSVVVDSQLGLPIEDLWSIHSLRQKGTRLAEVSTLAIKSQWRSKRGRLLFPLCKYMGEYCLQFLGVDILIAVTHPRVAHFYTDILLFEPLDSQDRVVKKYSSVEGALAKAQWLHLTEKTFDLWRRIYERQDDARNIYKFMMQTKFDNFKFPEPETYVTGTNFMTPAQLEHFFLNQCNVLDELKENERLALANVYFLDRYRSVLGIKRDFKDAFNRRHARFEVLGHTRFFHSATNTILRGTMLEASRDGLKLRLLSDIPKMRDGDEVQLTIELSPQTRVQLKAHIKWVHEQFSRVGLKLSDRPPLEWQSFIDYLETKLEESAKTLDSTKVSHNSA